MSGLTREQQNAFLGATIGAMGISQVLFPCSATNAHTLRLLGAFMTAFAFQLLKMNSSGILFGGIGVLYAAGFDYYQKLQQGQKSCCACLWMEIILGFFMFTIGASAFCADKAKEAATGSFPISSVSREPSLVASPSPAVVVQKKSSTATRRSTSSSKRK